MCGIGIVQSDKTSESYRSVMTGPSNIVSRAMSIEVLAISFLISFTNSMSLDEKRGKIEVALQNTSDRLYIYSTGSRIEYSIQFSITERINVRESSEKTVLIQ